MAVIPSLDTIVPVHTSGPYVTLSSFLRPANTTAYTSLDAVTTGEGGHLEFPGTGPSGKIIRASLFTTEIKTFDVLIHVFSAEPTAQADNAAFAHAAGDLEKYISVYGITNASKRTLGSAYAAYQNNTDRQVHSFTTATGKLYATIEIVTGFTPNSASKWMVRLDIERD